MQRLTILFLSLVTLSCFSFNATAKKLTVYSWVDENGIAHFSYVEPPQKKGVRSFELKDHSSFGAEKRRIDISQSEINDNNDPLIARKLKYCENAKHNLNVLENFDQVTQTDTDGNEVTITGSDKSKYIKTAKQRIKAFCN